MENPSIKQKNKGQPQKNKAARAEIKKRQPLPKSPIFKKMGAKHPKVLLFTKFIRFLTVKTPILSKTAPISSVFKQGVIEIFPKRCFCRWVLWQYGRRTTNFGCLLFLGQSCVLEPLRLFATLQKRCSALNQKGADKWRPARRGPLICPHSGTTFKGTRAIKKQPGLRSLISGPPCP